ncbi:MAG TPA: hypothetical protein VFE16_03980 [Candidatus Cybelea sp.]|jgi:hypothetical protein|nr:hypothetical protein [Candidatus Cybelea sp.]
MIAFAVLSTVVALATPSPSPSPKPTPNPWRQLEFGTPTLGGAPSGHIAVLGGWVAVKRDGRQAHACISFKNESSVTATRVVIDFIITSRERDQTATLKLDRRGTFSPGVDINGWSSMQNWQSGSNRRYDENCTGTSVAVAAFPLLSARLATYTILRVEYADGTEWQP